MGKNKLGNKLGNKVENKLGRADFIKKAALATAGFYIVPRSVLGGVGYVCLLYTSPSPRDS